MAVDDSGVDERSRGLGSEVVVPAGLIARAWSYFELLGEGRLDEAAALLDDAGTWWTCGSRREMSMAEHKALFPRALAAVPMRFRLRDAMTDGERVSLELESHAELPGGGSYDNVYSFVLTFRGDRILHVREYSDTAHVAAIAPSLGALYRDGI